MRSKKLSVLQWIKARENEGTERDTPSPRFEISVSIPLKLFIDWLLSGRVFPETSALRLTLVSKYNGGERWSKLYR